MSKITIPAPEQIESLSFEIIDKEAGEHSFTRDQWAVVRRMVHATGDFDFVRNARFHPKAIDAGIGALKIGAPVITDVKMLKSGVESTLNRLCGSAVHCFIHDPETFEMARRLNKTRAAASMLRAGGLLSGSIAAIGNAPTALLEIVEIIKEGREMPALIVGMPVGFVNAKESKELLLSLDAPYITVLGRKGGSGSAAAAVNALAQLAAG